MIVRNEMWGAQSTDRLLGTNDALHYILIVCLHKCIDSNCHKSVIDQHVLFRYKDNITIFRYFNYAVRSDHVVADQVCIIFLSLWPPENDAFHVNDTFRWSTHLCPSLNFSSFYTNLDVNLSPHNCHLTLHLTLLLATAQYHHLVESSNMIRCKV